MAMLAAAFLTLSVAQAGTQEDYERELARLRAEHQKSLAAIRDEANAFEEKASMLRRVVPPQFEPAAIEKQLQALAGTAKIPLDVTRRAETERVRLADGRATPYERHFLDLAGRADYVAFDLFFHFVARLPTLIELQTLSIDREPDDTVRFAARLAFPCYTGWPESASPAPPPAVAPAAPGPRSPREAALAEHRRFFARMAEEAREPIRKAQAEVDAVTEMKMQGAPARFNTVLARLANNTDPWKVTVKRARFGPRSVVEGVVLGASTAAGLRAAFEKAGFAVDTLDATGHGACRTFTLAARLTPATAPEEPEFGPNLFRGHAAASCGAPPEPSQGTIRVRGTSGSVTARLRGVTLPDVFYLLNTLGQGSFIVDPDVKGRVELDVDRATPEEIFAAMSAAGITIGPPPLRRVSLAGVRQPPLAHAASREEPVNMSFKDAALLDLLRLFEHISSRPTWTAPVVDGRVTLFATGVPWDLVLEAVATSAGLTALIEPGRLFVGPAAMAPPKSGAVEVARATTSIDEPPGEKVVGPAGLQPEDLTPIGFARTADGVNAVVYGPRDRLWVLEAGAELYEARVEAVDATGVTFIAKDGRKTVMRYDP